MAEKLFSSLMRWVIDPSQTALNGPGAMNGDGGESAATRSATSRDERTSTGPPAADWIVSFRPIVDVSSIAFSGGTATADLGASAARTTAKPQAAARTATVLIRMRMS